MRPPEFPGWTAAPIWTSRLSSSSPISALKPSKVTVPDEDSKSDDQDLDGTPALGLAPERGVLNTASDERKSTDANGTVALAELLEQLPDRLQGRVPIPLRGSRQLDRRRA